MDSPLADRKRDHGFALSEGAGMTFRVGQTSTSRDIAGYEGLYSVTIYGEVFSARSGLFLKGSPIPGGYLTVALHKDGEQATKTIHRLVAEAFISNPDGKPSINHIDSDKTNNWAANLEWCTPAENTHHAITAGRLKGAPLKLSSFEVAQVRSLYKEGFRMKWIADRFKVSTSTVKNIIRGKHYHFPLSAMLNPVNADA